MESLVLHEDHVADFEAADKVLNRGTKVATTGPDIFNKGDIVRVNSKSLRQPSVVELNALVLEEFVVVRLVKDLNSEHDEARVMASSQANVVEIVESGAELGANQGVSGRVKLSSHTVGLEAVNASCDVVHVVSPTSNDGVSLDGLAWNSCRGKTFFKS